MRCVLFAACLAAQMGAAPAIGEDDADIQGTWIAHARTPWRDGEQDPSVIGRRLTFNRGQFTITDPQGKLLSSGTYKLEGPIVTEQQQSAVAIRFVHTAGRAKGQTWLGIYATCPSLRITDNSADPSKPRPPGYHPKDKQGYASVRYSRTGRY